jgi:hypothetical protein
MEMASIREDLAMATGLGRKKSRVSDFSGMSFSRVALAVGRSKRPIHSELVSDDYHNTSKIS